MSRRREYMYHVSEALSEVMEDIGVNERFVMKTRRARLLEETIAKILHQQGGKGDYYMFGSQTEVTTTMGLLSDIDVLVACNRTNLIQNMNELEHGVINCMMVQHENISPGYCYLQRIKPLPVNGGPPVIIVFCVIDSEGRLLLNHMCVIECLNQTHLGEMSQLHGPAFTEPGGHGLIANDHVFGYYCKSAPHQVTSWLQKRRGGNWPTERILEQCRNSGCFVVPVGSKVHSPDILESELEWRISTSLQERYLMFSLNIPQLMCYILMKIILKTHITPVEEVLSSFMCKNVLMYCVANSSQDWHTGNLLPYLHLCLFMLKECIEQRNCPHFIIPENNLLAGRMTEGQRDKLLDIIDNLMVDDEELLYKIQIDDLGRRLKIKLNLIPDCSSIYPPELLRMIPYYLILYVAKALHNYLTVMLSIIEQDNLGLVHQFLSQTFLDINLPKIWRELIVFPHTDNDLLQTAHDLLIPLVSSTQGSVLACIAIDAHTAISDQAFTYLKAGKESDTLSGRLKLLSVFYCTGDMERAEHELTIIQSQCNIAKIHSINCCFDKPTGISEPKPGSSSKFEHYTEKSIKSNIALCTRFLRCEMNCVPHELKYEELKSYIEEDRQMRTWRDRLWMDLITVDSIPYLYYLQYKIYGQLQRRIEQVQALLNFAWSIAFERNLGHKETALNLFGQCQEKENRQIFALQCYIWSLKQRKRNNAARFLLCMQLLKLWKQNNKS